MSSLRLLLPSGRGLLLLDLVLLAWVILWIALGLAIEREVRGLRQVSGTVYRVGLAVEDTGSVLSALSSLPLVGSRVTRAAQRVEAAGRSAVSSSRASRRSAGRLS